MPSNTPTSGVKVRDLAFVRMTSPDLERSEAFLTDFGFVATHRDRRSLLMRGSATNDHLLTVTPGEPGVRSIAFSVDDESVLDAAAGLDGASPVEAIDEPGGSRRVRLTDPAGLSIELVHRTPAEPSAELAGFPVNSADGKARRAGIEARPAGGPCHVARLSHFVLVAPDLHRVAAWYEKTLGVLCSDCIYRDRADNIVAYFYRADQGRADQGGAFVDHHMINLFGGGDPGINHLAFEVRDIDDVMIGHEFLRSKSYKHMRGPGRHFVGSQIFDYWVDPWGCMFEHITDSDVFDASKPRGLIKAGETESHWGASSFAEFRSQLAPLSGRAA